MERTLTLHLALSMSNLRRDRFQDHEVDPFHLADQRALIDAVQSGHILVASGILDAAFDVNDTPEPLLHIAVARGNLRMASFLLERGADPLRIHSNGRTALMVAASCSNPSLVELLLPVSDAKHRDPATGETALMRAASSFSASAQIIGLLADASDVDAQDHAGRTALYAAVANGNTTMAAELASRAQCFESPPGRDPLAMRAASHDGKNVFLSISPFLPQRAIDAQNGSGDTALMRALKKPSSPAALFLAQRSDLTIRNANGDTAFEMALGSALDTSSSITAADARWRLVDLMAPRVPDDALLSATASMDFAAFRPTLRALTEAAALRATLRGAAASGPEELAGDSSIDTQGATPRIARRI